MKGFPLFAAHLCALLVLSCGGQSTSKWLPLRLPKYETSKVDAYLCASFSMPDDMLSLTHIAPQASQEVVHHILLFGCADPQKPPGQVWECHTHGLCRDASHILYGWGKDAPTLELPENVGFSIGKGTQIPNIVLQVHYLKGRPAGDNSGVDIKLADYMPRRSVSIVAFAPFFSIPPGRASYDVKADCCVSGFQPLVPLAFRVHAHALGRKITLDKSPGSLSPEVEAREKVRMAERDPQLPQMFQMVDRGLPWIVPGDRLETTCNYDSRTAQRSVSAGWGHDAEMCNMYYMVHSEQTHFTMCWNGGSTEAHPLPEAVVRPFPLPMIASGSVAAQLGGITAVAVDPRDGSLWLLTRQKLYMGNSFYHADNTVRDRALIPEDTVYNVDPVSGRVLASWGGGVFSLPHSLTIDWSGNFWITDCGLHQVFKFSRTGKQLLALGDRFKPGASNATFCRPTDVRVLPDGTALISDGYCNSRMLTLAPGSTGERGLEVLDLFVEGQSPAMIVHSVTVDACPGRAYLAAREEGGVFEVQLNAGARDRQRVRYWPSVAADHGLKPGRVWAVRTGPAGRTFMLLQESYDWERGRTYLASFDGPTNDGRDPFSFLVELEGIKYPHDFAFATLPDAFVETSVPIVVYVSETPPYAGTVAKVHRFVLSSGSWADKPLELDPSGDANSAQLSTAAEPALKVAPARGDPVPGKAAADAQPQVPPPHAQPEEAAERPATTSADEPSSSPLRVAPGASSGLGRVQTVGNVAADNPASAESAEIAGAEASTAEIPTQEDGKRFAGYGKPFLERTNDRSRMGRGWGTGLPDLVMQAFMGAAVALVAFLLYQRSQARPASQYSSLPTSQPRP